MLTFLKEFLNSKFVVEKRIISFHKMNLWKLLKNRFTPQVASKEQYLALNNEK